MVVLKRISSLLLLLPLLAVMPGAVFSQTKVGYIDASKLLKQMPEAVDAESRLAQLVGQWTHDADDIQNELNRKSSEFDRRKLIMTDAERTAFEVELQNLRKRLDDFKQEKYGPTGELYSQQSQLMRPAYDRLQKAIEEVARDGSYDFVIDRSSRGVTLLYANAKYDLTLVVAHKLGLETDALTQPLINNNANTNQNGQVKTSIPSTNGQPPPNQNGANPPIQPPIQPNPNGVKPPIH